MSKWLGFSTCSSRDQGQAEKNGVVHHSASDAHDGISNGARKTDQNPNREETDLEFKSPEGSRSARISEVSKVAISNSDKDNSSVIIRPINTMISPGLAGTGEDLEDWEEIMPENVEQDCSEQSKERERPHSPGVDFSECNGNPFGLEGASVSEGCADEQGSTGCSKWIDARDSHNFLVRGPTYLVVSEPFIALTLRSLLAICTCCIVCGGTCFLEFFGGCSIKASMLTIWEGTHSLTPFGEQYILWSVSITAVQQNRAFASISLL